jgi:hypothetical protein
MASQASNTVLPTERESRDVTQFIAVLGAALLVGIMYFNLPDRLRLGPSGVVLILVALAFAPPTVAKLLGMRLFAHAILRTLNLAALAIMTVALVTSLGLLVHELPRLSAHGDTLLVPAALLWLSNVLIASIWYWEVDGDGPRNRRLARQAAIDFQFPQRMGGNRTGWQPGFIDYLFLAFCFATALSPADTFPLSHRAKLMMMAQATISLTVLVLVIARSVNII